MGLILFIFQYCKDAIKAIEDSLSDRLVTIEQSNQAILIKGSESGLVVAVKEIKKVYSNIKRETFLFQRPGVRKLFDKSFIKDVLRSIGNEHSLVIINESDDIEAIIEEEYAIIPKIEDTSRQSRIVCNFKTKEGKTLSVYQGDITKHTVDVIVNPANNSLLLGGGVAGAILAAGGKSIQDECNEYVGSNGELIDGDVAVTGAGQIECKRIIHTVGPHWQAPAPYIGERELHQKQDKAKKALRKAIDNTLIAAMQYQSVAIPAVSSGVFGFPKDLCAEILVSATLEFSRKIPMCNLREIHFINNDTPTVKIFEREFERAFKLEAGFKKYGQLENEIGNSKEEWWRDLGKDKHLTSRTYKNPSKGNKKEENEKIPLSSQNNDVTKPLSTPEGITVELVVGDLSQQKVDVIVNSASSSLNLASNPCARTLGKAAGPKLQVECTSKVSAGALPIWDFAITKGWQLKCQFVYHAICAEYDKGAGQSEQDLGALVEKLLNKASKDKLKSMAFPALGTGILGFPRDSVAHIMLDSVFKFCKSTPTTSLTNIYFVAYNLDVPTVTAFQTEFKNYNGSSMTSSVKGSEKKEPQTKVHRAAKKPSSVEDSVSENIQENQGDVSIMLDNLLVELVNGDITKENTDAIVVIGNEGLNFGGAVGRAIVRKEGEEFLKQAQKEVRGRQESGTTTFIRTQRIPAHYVAHLVPASPDNPSKKDMINSTYKMLQDAENRKLTSLSLPAIGSGMLGFSPRESASIILHSLGKLHLFTNKKSRSFLKKIRIVIFEEIMLETFKEELTKILNSPEEYLDNSDDENGLIEWIKSAYKKVRNVFYAAGPPIRTNSLVGPKEIPRRTKTKAENNEFYDVSFNIYSPEQRNIQKAKKRIEGMIDENITPVSTKKPAFSNLSEVQKDLIKKKARQSDVSITFDKDGTITVVGFHADTSVIMDFCHEVVLNRVEEESQIEKGNLIAEIVQWVEVATDNSRTEFDTEINMQIEKAYNNGEKRLKVALQNDGGKIYNYDLDLKERKGKADDGTSFALERVEKRTGQGISLPEHWSQMPTNNSGTEVPFHVEKLPSTSAEYQAVHKEVMASHGGTINNVLEIRRIQNPQLYKSFITRKETMDKLKGSNERQLFHGTAETSCDGINHHGLNRSLAGVNGTAFGLGVYFAVDSAYSAGYAKQGTSGKRYMYLAKVLTGESAQGHPSYKTAPGKPGGASTDVYDTVVNNTASPRIFVTFFDNQCYPEYLIVFQ